LPAIHKIVAYESLIFFGQLVLEEFKGIILQRYDKYIEEGRVIESMVSLTKDSKVFKVNLIPDFILVLIFKLILWINARTVKAGMSLQSLSPQCTMNFDRQKTEGTLENYKEVSAEVLLLRSSKSEPLLKDTQDIEHCPTLISLNFRA
jgi:hypothetical protein